MANRDSLPLVAVDVGNSRIKLGDFEPPLATPLPHPNRTVALPLDWTDADLRGFLPQDPGAYAWAVASVNRPAAARLSEWLAAQGASPLRILEHTDLNLPIELAEPARVGMDRLTNAVAINQLRDPARPAIVIDIGSAITVDLVRANGAFAGGAILPGMGLSARALHQFTDLLPLVKVAEPPPALGRSTVEAINSGLYWGAVGAIRELIARLDADEANAQVFITGGGAPNFINVLNQESQRPAQFVPHLTLAGIALTAERLAALRVTP